MIFKYNLRLFACCLIYNITGLCTPKHMYPKTINCRGNILVKKVLLLKIMVISMLTLL